MKDPSNDITVCKDLYVVESHILVAHMSIFDMTAVQDKPCVWVLNAEKSVKSGYQERSNSAWSPMCEKMNGVRRGHLITLQPFLDSEVFIQMQPGFIYMYT